MAKPTGFMEFGREDIPHRTVDERVKDYFEINLPLSEDMLTQQAARCMDCGIPFCHGMGCPVKNLIPEFNELVYRGLWQQACDNLHSTNNFPEITGRICPAPCEAACTLGFNDEPVLIRHIEYQIVERGFEEGWIKPLIAIKKSGKRVAVIGSGPAGLAAAQQLARAGHSVVIFEKDESVGGLLRYGIPDFKLDKKVIDRRMEQLKAEGVEFRTGVNVGEDISARYLHKMFDAVCLTIGAGQPRDLQVTGRDNANVFYAMEYLAMQNQINAGEETARQINAKGKHVVVIGGGDTGSDCVGTARRQGAAEISQLEILPKPPESRPDDTPWPLWPRIMRSSTSHEEGCNRRWSVMTKEIVGGKGGVKKLKCCEVEWEKDDSGKWNLKEVEGSEFTLKANLVMLAMGFVHVVHEGLVKALELDLDDRGNVKIDNYQASQPWVFAAGDTVSGASLVVRAINSGREMAEAVDNWLKNQ